MISQVVKTENTIMLKIGKNSWHLNRHDNINLFDSISALIKQKDFKTIEKEYATVIKEISVFSNKHLIVSKNRLRLKGDKDYMPPVLSEKLRAMMKAKTDHMPLIRFWKKLKKNPNPESIKELYTFMQATKIPITNNGDLLCEKGVMERDGKLWDLHSGTYDNSIGATVTFKGEIDLDRHKTCADSGLHVASPDHVRKWYNENKTVQVVVNPADVASVPIEEDAGKIRVRAYTVIGFAPTEPIKEPVGEIIDIVNYTKPNILKKLTSKEIIKLVQYKFGITISDKSKSKKRVLAQATKIIKEGK